MIKCPELIAQEKTGKQAYPIFITLRRGVIIIIGLIGPVFKWEGPTFHPFVSFFPKKETDHLTWRFFHGVLGQFNTLMNS